MLRLRMRQLKCALKITVGFILSIFMGKSKNYNKCCLICERGNDACDNGFAFYEYIIKNNKMKNPYYLITPDSVDIKKFHDKKNLVSPGSLKHFIILFSSCFIASAHSGGYLEGTDDVYSFMQKMKKHIKAKIIFLQHGITKNFHPCFCYPLFNVDMFVAGAYPEYEYLCTAFSQPQGVVKYTGFARYDKLFFVKAENQILIMPTWRTYLENLSDDEFKESSFYKHYQSLINNKELVNTADDDGTHIIFYLHEMLQKYTHLFSCGSSNIIIASKEKYDVSVLLRESKMLITDFSSVYFDFAYMKRPMIFYQFDEKEYFSGHYEKGYFDYRTMGFGDVCINEKELIDLFLNVKKSNYELCEKYEKRAASFFKMHDTDNCERIYNAIQELIRK